MHCDGYNNARGQHCHKGITGTKELDKICLKFASHHFLLYVVYMCQKSLNYETIFSVICCRYVVSRCNKLTELSVSLNDPVDVDTLKHISEHCRQLQVLRLCHVTDQGQYHYCFLPRTHNTFADRSSTVAGPRVWNSLHLGVEMQFRAFRRQLKTVLFSR